MKVDIDSFNNELPKNAKLFICSINNEERWSKIALEANLESLQDVVVINSGVEIDSELLSPIRAKYGDRVRLHELDIKTPILAWKSLLLNITSLIEKCDGAVIFDISTLNKEHVLFIVSQLAAQQLMSKVTFTYVAAKSYGGNTTKGPIWLTRGVKNIRSVIGFPGGYTPSKNQHHLIILVGFELDRAKELILAYEPTSISLGIGIEPYIDKFQEENQRSMDLIQSFINSLGITYKSLSEFTFSCSDVHSAKKSILNEVSKFEGSNITISPMNTKVSTAALGLAAIENEDIKVCYVEPLEYNKDCYSEVGDTVTVFRLDN
jgi:hypothetical protein